MDSQSLPAASDVSAVLVRTPGKPGDLNSVLLHIAQTAHDAFGTDACVILAFNPITSRFISAQTVGNLYASNELLHDKPRPEGVTQQVLRDGLVLIEDLEPNSQYHNRFTRREGFRTFAGLALRTRHRKRPLGVIYLDFRQPRTFSSTECESFRIFAFQAAFLLQEAWLAHHYEEIARIGQEVNHNLATVADLFQILQTYVDTALDDSHTLLLAIYQPQTNTLDFYMRGPEHSTFLDQPLQGACKYILETQESQFIRQLSREAEHLPFQVINISGTEEKESLIFVPLLLRGVPLGVLSIQHALPDAYGQEDLFVLQLLANYLSLALHNMRLYNSLHQLNETGQILTQQLESEQTLQATVDKIREATQADVVVLYPYEPVLRSFILPPRMAGTLLEPTFPRASRLRPDDMANLALNHVDPIFAKESASMYIELDSHDRLRQENFKDREKISSTAVIPLRVGEESVGVLFVSFRQPQRFDATQKLLIEGLAHYAAIAIKNSQVFGTLSLRRVRELEILQDIDRELNRNLALAPVLHTLLKLAYEQVPAEEASILLYNPRIQALEIPAAIGPQAEARRTQIISQTTQGITQWVLEHKKPARVDNVHLDPQWRDLYILASADTVSELDVPLLDGEEVVGVLNFESTREAAFHQEDEHFLITLAGQAVLAIKNAQAYEREKHLAEEQQVLNEISKEITSQLDHVRVFDLILEKALTLTRSTLGSLHLYYPDMNEVRMVADRGVAEDKKGQRQKLGEGIVGHVAQTKQMVNAEDVTQLPWNELYLEFFPGARSELTVPMLVGDELRGVLNVESPSPKNFSERDERLLQGLADLAVIALQNAQAFEREKRLVAEGQVLYDISQEITSQLDHVRIFDLIIKKALELTRSTLGTLWLYDPEQHILWMAAERGVVDDRKGKRITLDQGIVGYVARYKELLMVDPTEPPWNEIYIAFVPGTRSELTVPMLAGDEIRGVLNIESPVPHNFNEGDARLIKGLADLAVVALQNAERYEQARREAQRFALLYQAGQELSKITDLEQLDQAYDTVLHIAEEQSQSLVVIRRYDEDAQELELIRASEPHYAALYRRTTLDVGINGQVARERRTILIPDINHPPPNVVAPQPSDPATRSLLITPIVFKEQYYGNLGLDHKDVGHFQGADILFFEGLAQQLASTIHRLETAKARQEFEQRALSAEEMSSIGQSAFEVTHRLGNDLGLVEFYISEIESEMQKQGVSTSFVSKKLANIQQSVKAVLTFSVDLKEELAKLRTKEEMAGKPVLMAPRALLEEAAAVSMLPSNIQIYMEFDNDVSDVRVFHSLVADILRNLVANAIQAMPEGGTLSLRAHNAGRSVALEVSDTGIGIPKQKLANIFDLFFSTKGSSGFGLWSARRNALKNHGDLKVQSKPGQGTTFTLLLPRTNGDHHDVLLQHRTNLDDLSL